MKRATLHPLADEEMNAQARYYEERVPGLGKSFLEQVGYALERILESPRIGAPAGLPLRRIGVRRFPHSIIYAPTRAGIYVLAIAHHSREPEYWRDRA